jgi:hypothetical protein
MMTPADPDPRRAQLTESERKHAELVASLPKHSVTAAHLQQIEELEEAIAALRAALAADSDDPQPAI